MTKLKKLIIFFVIIIVMIIVSILVIIHFNKAKLIYNIDETGSTDEETENFDNQLKLVTSRNEYYSVKQCVDKFYTYYGSIFDDSTNQNSQYPEEYTEVETTEEDKSESVEKLLKMLDKDYINKYSITENNLVEKIDKVKSSKVDINEMYVSQINTNVSVYVVKGRLMEQKTKNMSDFMIMLKLDLVSKTFSIFLNNYIKDIYANTKVGENVEWKFDENIEKNDTNIYDYKNISDQTYIQDLLGKYQSEVLYDQETAYNNLDEEYRNARFGSYENFLTYAKQNIIRNVKLKLSKYQINNYENYKEYVCQDGDGNYYIFNEKGIMNYGLLLDTYSVNIPEFKKKYDSATDQVKVGMNIEKIKSAIKEKDYNYIYNKLDDTFKKNYFDSIDKFKEYIQKVFTSDEITYDEFKDLGGVYTYKLLINDEASSNVTIIMQLNDNYDFKMSFSV